jgi:hypothetical protein
MDAGSTASTLTTRPVKFSGKYMFVNVKDPQGSLQIQVLNPTNNQVLATSNPLAVDSTLQQVTWIGLSDLSSFAGQAIEFQFTLTNGELYAFWVGSGTNGASSGYVAAGGPGFTTNVDTVGSAGFTSLPATGSNFSVSTNTLYLTARVSSSNAVPEVITISDLGGTLSWSVIASQPWLTLSSSSGSGVQSIAVSAATSGLAIGTYSGTLTISAPDATPSVQTVSVSLTITP